MPSGLSRPRYLALDISGAPASVYLGSGDANDAQARCRSLPATSLPSEQLAPAIASLLAEAGQTAGQLSGVVVAVGPGSFTGLRVGLATAKGICLGAGIGLWGVSSLAVLAASASARMSGTLAAHCWQVVAVHARHDEVFAAVYEVSPAGLAVACLGDCVMSLAALAQWTCAHAAGRRLNLVGDAAGALAEALGNMPATIDEQGPDARLAIAQAADSISCKEAADLFDVVPTYLKRSAAERNTVAV